MSHDPVEWEIYGDETGSIKVDVVYKKRNTQRFLVEVDIEDAGIRLIRVGKYGYRLYDVDARKFISKEDALERITDVITDAIYDEFKNDFFRITYSGTIDLRTGEIILHANMEPLSLREYLERAGWYD